MERCGKEVSEWGRESSVGLGVTKMTATREEKQETWCNCQSIRGLWSRAESGLEVAMGTRQTPSHLWLCGLGSVRDKRTSSSEDCPVRPQGEWASVEEIGAVLVSNVPHWQGWGGWGGLGRSLNQLHWVRSGRWTGRLELLRRQGVRRWSPNLL